MAIQFDVDGAYLQADRLPGETWALPPKQMIKNESAEFLQRRQQLLAGFLQAVIDDKVLSMSAELCAFLECEAGSQLAAAMAVATSCSATLLHEVSAAETLAQTAETALTKSEAHVADLRAALAAERAAHAATAAERDTTAAERDTAVAERDAARDAAKAGRQRVLAMLCRGRERRRAAHSFAIWAAGTEPKPSPPPPPDVGAALTAALSAALSAVGNAQPPSAEPTAADTARARSAFRLRPCQRRAF